MKLYPKLINEVPVLSTEDSNEDDDTLSTETVSNAGADGITIRTYRYPANPNVILENKEFNFMLDIAATKPLVQQTGTETYGMLFRPTLRLVSTDLENPQKIAVWVGEDLSITSNTNYVKQYSAILDSISRMDTYDLELEFMLIIDKEESDPLPFSPGSITVQTETIVDVPLFSGEFQSLGMHSTVEFTRFQLREKIRMYSTVDVTESIRYREEFGKDDFRKEVSYYGLKKDEIPESSMVFTVSFFRQEQIKVYSTIELQEINSMGIYYHTKYVSPSSTRYITELDMGDYFLPQKFSSEYPYEKNKKNFLKKKGNLEDKVESLSSIPDVIYPPDPLGYDTKLDSYASLAERFADMSSMLSGDYDLDVDEDVISNPNNSVIVWNARNFLPNSQVTLSRQRDVWVLPVSHAGQNVTVPFSTKINSTTGLNQTKLLLFSYRLRSDNVSVSASYEGKGFGKRLLKKRISPTDDVYVWMWKDVQVNAKSTTNGSNDRFRVNLTMKSSNAFNPAMQGKYASMMVI